MRMTILKNVDSNNEDYYCFHQPKKEKKYIPTEEKSVPENVLMRAASSSLLQ